MREITDAEIERTVDSRALVEASGLCLRALGEGRATQACKQQLPVPGGGFFFSISAVVPETGWAVAKWASYVPAQAGVPGHSTSTILVSPADGCAPVAVLTGMLPTRLRTAASAIALLARLDRLSADSVIGLIGFGPTNQAVAAMIADVAGTHRWRALCRTEASLKRAGEALLGEARTDVHAGVLADCDIVISATGAQAPVADATALRDGTVVLALDGARTWHSDGIPTFDDRSTADDPGDIARIMSGARIVPRGTILLDQAGSAVTDVALAAVLMGTQR